MERKYNIFTKIMLKFLLEFPSAASIRDVSRRIAKIVKEQRGRRQYPLEKIELAKNSIGIKSESTEDVLRTYVNKLLLLEEKYKKFSLILDVKTREIYRRERKFLSSIPEICDDLAIYFLAEIGEIKRFENARKLIAYIGIDPVIKQSGEYEARFSISKRGNRHLRRTLYLMVVNIIRFDGKFRKYFETHRRRGKTLSSHVYLLQTSW